MKKFILILFAFICFGWVIGKPQGMVAQPLSNSWCWHTDGGFKYPRVKQVPVPAFHMAGYVGVKMTKKKEK